MQEVRPVQKYLYKVEDKEVLLTPQRAAYLAYDHHVEPVTRAPIARDGMERAYTLVQEVAR